MHFASFALLVSVILPTSAFLVGNVGRSVNKFALNSVAAQATPLRTSEAPDFYWEFRLKRLANRQGAALPFNAKNYPDVEGFQNLYDAYYLDLTLQGKLEGFDWEGEKKISDQEWLSIYSSISKWSKEVAKQRKTALGSLPTNDFDLLKQYYPNINYRDLEVAFSEEEVGSSFPYRTMKDLLGDALAGKLNIPGYSTSITTIEGKKTKQALADLKEASMKNLDDILQNCLAFAETPYPDEASRTHYKSLKATFGTFPQSPAEWDAYRAKLQTEIDEMTLLASKKDEHHEHHEEEGEEGEGEHHDEHEKTLSAAEEFEAKYGKSLADMQEKFSSYKSDPVKFLEKNIRDGAGVNGVEVWKKTQEFAEEYKKLSAEEILKTEKLFTDFLNKV